MTYIDEAKHNDTESDDAMAQALDLHRCLAECQGLGSCDAAHVLIGCGLFALSEDLPLDEALDHLEFVREMITKSEAELRAGAN